MTPEKVLVVIEIYKNKLQELGVNSNRLPGSETPTTKNGFLGHCRAMLDITELLTKDDRMEKTFRWLGFIQGVFWVLGLYTIDEMKNHNRSDSE